MDFNVDKARKKRIARGSVTASTGGTVAAALGALTMAAGPVLAVLLYGWLENGGGRRQMGLDAQTGSVGLCAAVAAFFLVVGGVVLACAFRQRNASVGVRVDERLGFEGGVLQYSYRADSPHNGTATWVRLCEVSIPLDRVSVRYRERERVFAFEGDIRVVSHRADVNDAANERMEVERVASFTIGDYFGPEFTELMGRFMR